MGIGKIACALALMGLLAQLSPAQQKSPKPGSGKVRTYYVAADEVE